MARANPFQEQVEANLPKLDARPEFGSRLWLTFYLTGPPQNLREVSDSVKALGWSNVEGWEGGFLYPKVRVNRSVEGVVLAANAALDFCLARGVEILNIDADTSPDVESSRFATLYRS